VREKYYSFVEKVRLLRQANKERRWRRKTTDK
jgi:hypothetical protein